MDTRTPATSCPSCGYHMDAAAGVNHEHRPSPGDWSLCLNCGTILVFTEDLHLRAATAAEIAAAMAHEETRNVLQRGQALIRKRGPIRKA